MTNVKYTLKFVPTKQGGNHMGKTILVGARKGGVGKTMTAASLGVGLARQGKKTLIIDCDSQFSLTVSLGIKEPEKLYLM